MNRCTECRKNRATRTNGLCGGCNKDRERRLLDDTEITWERGPAGVMHATEVHDPIPDGPNRTKAAS